MTAGNIRNRHPGLGCLLDHGKLLIRRVPAPALDAGKDFYSINTVRHSRKTRHTPSSYLSDCVRFKKGLLHVTTTIEALVYRIGFKFTVRWREYGWLVVANAASVAVAFISLFLVPVRS